MSLFRSSLQGPPTSLELSGPRVALRLGKPTDWQVWRDLRAISRDFLTPWEPHWPADALTFDRYASSLRQQWRDWKEGSAYSFHLFLKRPPAAELQSFAELAREETRIKKEAPQLVGGIALTHIERGASQSGRLGYWIGAPFARQGLMAEACEVALSFGFETLRLHRIEANCMPSNVASLRLLDKLGFEREGLARSFLRINGAWEDHLLWGKRGEKKS